MYIGRLDKNSQGLLLLTNSGELVRDLSLPSHNLEREYEVRVYGRIPYEMAEMLQEGIEIAGMQYRPIQMSVIEQYANNTWLKFILTEGKNREIRNICDYFGLKISRLIRTRFAIFELGELPVGKYVKVKDEVVDHIRTLLV